MPNTSPFEFNSHPLVLLAGLLSMIGYPILLSLALQHRNKRIGIATSTNHPLLTLGLPHTSTKQVMSYYLGTLLGVLSLGWPIGDLARRYSLTFYLVSNSILILGATPLMLIGLQGWCLAELTRGRRIDCALRHLTRPVFSTAFFTASLLVSMIPGVVEFESMNSIFWVGFHIFLVFSATVMWVSGLNLLPGLRRLSSLGRVAFFFVQSLLPTFPAVILIFAKRSLYKPYMYQAQHLGIAPLADQQLAGGIVKIISIIIFWSVAGVILARSNKDEELGFESSQITWDDVEREFQRSTPRTS